MRVSYAENLQEVETEVGVVVNSLFTIEQVMIKDIVSVSSTATIKEVTEILATKEFHALPVVVDENILVGIVTTTDLIKYLLEQY